MSKAIRLQSIDTVTTLLLAVLVAMVLTLSNISAGIVGGGSGGGDDEGSGIGGTGKRGGWGGGDESGFGGTGFKPSLGYNPQSGEILMLASPELLQIQRIEQGSLRLAIDTLQLLTLEDFAPQLVPMPEPLPVPELSGRSLAIASSPLPISTIIQLELEANALLLPIDQIAPWELTLPDPTLPTQKSWGTLADLSPDPSSTQDVSEGSSLPRASLPERIQRPDLPPIQRARPVERLSILPPRVQPMRI